LTSSCKRHVQKQEDALRNITEDYLREHPELFLGDNVQELIEKAPILSDDELEQVGADVFRGVDIAKLVAEGRS
jgi:hypothetical protein